MIKSRSRYAKDLRRIPHFYIIRAVESRLISDSVDKVEGPVLDLGCGDGSFGESLCLRDLYGIDIDEKAIEASKNRNYKEAYHADASKIPFADRFFPAVFSNCALEHMDVLSDVLKEVNRVLKENGNFIFTVPSSSILSVFKEDETLQGISLNTDDSIREYNEFHHHVNLFSLQDWKKILETAGFKIAGYQFYLPGEIGRFVARMDMLYSVETPVSKELLGKLEKKYRSLAGFPFRMRCKWYIARPYGNRLGTHVMIKAAKI